MTRDSLLECFMLNKTILPKVNSAGVIIIKRITHKNVILRVAGSYER